MYEFMKKYFIEDIVSKIGEEVELYGWVNNVRDHKKIIFVDIRDRSGIVQIIGNETFRELSPEDVVYIKGTVQKRPDNLINPKVKMGTIEVKASEFKILSHAETPPFDTAKEELDVTLPTLLDYRPLTLRHPKVASIFKVQNVIIESFRQNLKKNGFMEFQAPIIVPATAEGGAEVFPVEYFDHKAYLAQSPQLYKQMMLGVFERVYAVTHAFRAEPSVTTRHLTEYISLDAEICFIDSWTELMDITEHLIKHILTDIDSYCKEELKIHNASLPKAQTSFPRLKLREAQEIILKRTKRDARQEPDLAPADEEEICKWAREEHNVDFVFITHYPVAKRPFYTFEDPEDPGYTLSFDLLGRGLEWVTGGQRINDYQQLVSNLKKWGNKPDDFGLYLQAFQFGIPPEGGFAMGAERITAKILGLTNIREASLFPRDMERVDIRLNDIKK